MSSGPGAFFGLDRKIATRTSLSVISVSVQVGRGVSVPLGFFPPGSGCGGKKA
jgi:hypothetical protein